MDIERGQAFRGSEFNLKLSPLPVTDLVTWTVSEDILVAQLYSNLNGSVSQIIDVIHRESAAAGDVCDLTQQIRPAHFFRSGTDVVKDANGVDLDISLLDHGFDLGIGITAAIVTAIGDDKQRLLGILGVTHLGERHVDSVEQGGASLRVGHDQLALDVLNRRGEIGDQLRLVGEGDHKKFVLRIRGLEELDHGVAGFANLVAYAAAQVEDDAQ